MQRLTLDTSVLLEYVKEQERADVAGAVIALHAAGSAEVAVTRYVDADVPREPRASQIRDLPILRSGGVFTLGFSMLGGADGVGWQELLDVQHALGGWRPSRGKVPDVRDWNHLHAHVIQRRDVFLTWDEGLLELSALIAPILEQPALREGLVPLLVMRPEDYLELSL